ncbi:hypothetical protein [Roseateles koreensis]|uniref:DUF2059 domain-containing protein n=1 Tax=Roseateles koreensis TaxID=2987526 RepID=A0ABT5KSI7_9BURK|nr:hypothetical protein [Roseateles koreensis]MDC8785898.1 hypothetical protein [Roseateles koreensis]
MKIALAFVCVLLLWPAWAESGCQSKNAAQVMQVLGRGIDLNERFKRSVNVGNETAYRALRKQNEQYGEETALPCVRRAVEILDEALDEPLLQRLMAYAISHENSADETTSEAMATVFARYPDAVLVGVASFVPTRARILVRSIESGWPGVRKTLEPAIRDQRDAQLKAMRAERVNKASAK